MSATCLCRSVVVSVNIFCLPVFVCELTFGQLSVGELSHFVLVCVFVGRIQQDVSHDLAQIIRTTRKRKGHVYQATEGLTRT